MRFGVWEFRVGMESEPRLQDRLLEQPLLLLACLIYLQFSSPANRHVWKFIIQVGTHPQPMSATSSSISSDPLVQLAVLAEFQRPN